MDVNEQGHDASKRYLGLSFSGGGYRAASFALGTLALMEDLALNEKTLVLSGVSGGSIALGAYLCAKAGAEARIEAGLLDRNDWFSKDFFCPFLTCLSEEKMARSFVNLSWLLQPRKLVKAAADANDRLFHQLLDEQATIGSPKIQSLLNHENLAPDYAFFNASDISSLNLFRFGIQKHHSGPEKLKNPSGKNETRKETDIILGH
jgi:predicted acylesterase/phospholipase RssA